MARRGGARHLKRLAAPSAAKLPRKRAVWLARPLPGRPAQRALALLPLLRDVLHVARSAHEVRALLRDGKILLDGAPARKPRAAVGLMDIIAAPALGKAWRIVLRHGVLQPVEISPEEAAAKWCRVTAKKTLRGAIALTLHDGRTLLTPRRDIAVGDSVKIALPRQHLLEHVPLRVGARCYITGGKYSGTIATLKALTPRRRGGAVAALEAPWGMLTTLKEYVFPIAQNVKL